MSTILHSLLGPAEAIPSKIPAEARLPRADCLNNLGDSHPSAGDVTPEEAVGFVYGLTFPSLVISSVI